MNNTLPLQIKNLSKSFNHKTILNNINLEVAQGDIFGLIGLNGIGKTTLIKIIQNLLPADSGHASLFGIATTLPKSREKTTFLPEKLTPSPFLKGHEFLTLCSNGLPNTNKIEELAEALCFCKTALKQPISKYSKGMSQKLALISSFSSNTPLLILDEPMSGLDPLARIELKSLIKNYQKQGNTIFFSSHILSDIDELCNKIAIIHDTNIIFSGSPHTFKQKYNAKTLELSFIKAINHTT